MKVLLINEGQTHIPQQDIIIFTLNQFLDSQERGFCEELWINDILDYRTDRNNILQQLLTKVKYGGKIYIEGINLPYIVHQLYTHKISISHATQLLYNKRQSCSSLHDMTDLLHQAGFKIVDNNINYTQCTYSITAMRPKPNAGNS